tara:strand:- start:251 stop:811 length:561 start_codon:yes stop_codon:yes gene_type:complete
VRALATWSGALAGLLLILIGGLLPAAILLPPYFIDLPTTWQVPALLLCALVCGPRAGVIAAVAYLSIGLMNLEVFHGGGGLEYVLEPGFGYLAGFVPAAWLTGRLAQQNGMGDLVAQTGAAMAGLVILQLCGLLNLGLGALIGRWEMPLPQLLFQFSIGPLPAQLLLCTAIGVLAVMIRRFLLIEE